MIDVLPVVAPGMTVTGASLPVAPMAANAASGVIVSAMLVEAVKLPEVPVIAMVTGPATKAASVAVRVITCVSAAEPAAKDAVTPDGSPVAVRATVPLNGPTLVTEIVLVPLAP